MEQVQTEELLDKINDAWATKPIDLSEIVHGTYLEPMPYIMKDGLNRMKRNHIHFAIGLPDD